MLPNIEYPTYFTKLPSNKKKVEYRSFTVKEQKLLLIALEDVDNHESVSNAIGQIISNCTMGKVKLDDLAPFDIEHMFLQLRIKSLGEILNLKYKCRNTKDDGNVCGHEQEIHYDLNDAKVEVNEDHNPIIEIDSGVGFEMSYPKTFTKIPDDIDGILKYLSSMIKLIYSGDDMWKSDDISEDELVEWIESIPPEALDKMKDFSDSIPTLSGNIKFKCENCGYKENIHMEGLLDFFG